MILHSHQAVAAVERALDCKLTYCQRRVVMLEGYSTGPYLDTKGITTDGVGLTGEWIRRGFLAAFRHHVDRVKARLPAFDDYPEYLQGELIQAEYRGDLGISPKAMTYLRDRRYEVAAGEFLDHAEYRSTTSKGIRARIKAVSVAIQLYGLQE